MAVQRSRYEFGGANSLRVSKMHGTKLQGRGKISKTKETLKCLLRLFVDLSCKMNKTVSLERMVRLVCDKS